LASLVGRWLYRSRQFFGALLGRVSKEEMAEARQVLGPRLFEMFAELPAQYRRHALTVYRRVQEGGWDDSSLLQAALLHDAGKYDSESGRQVTLAHRVAIVLFKATPPGKRLLVRLAEQSEPQGFTGYLFYPFYLSKHHAEIAARRASSLGATPEVVDLIANHHRHDYASHALATLQAADEAS
jgi:hypothetical protein